MKKSTLIAITILFSAATIIAQVTVKKDIMSYFAMLPAMPSSMQDAYQKCICRPSGCTADSLVSPINRSLKGDQGAMGNLTATQEKVKTNGEALGTQMQNDHVQQMNDDQKLQYAQNNQQLNGGNPDAIAWAQKMKDDPAEKAKFQAMTPDQKMAYMQQNGLMKSANYNSQFSMGTSDSGKATDALRKLKQMQTTESNDPKVQAFNDATDMTKINQAHSQLDQQQQAELSKLNLGEGTTNAAAAKVVSNKYKQKHLDLASTELQNMVNAYNDLYNSYKNAAIPFCSAVQSISYGYTGDANQDHEINMLAMGQAEVLNYVSQLTNGVKTIYEFGAKWQVTSLQ